MLVFFLLHSVLSLFHIRRLQSPLSAPIVAENGDYIRQYVQAFSFVGTDVLNYITRNICKR